MLKRLLYNRYSSFLLRQFERRAVSSSTMLGVYNRLANSPDSNRRERLCNRSARNLYGSKARFAWEEWLVRDQNIQYKLPLRNASAGFDWARALTALGHDIEVKQMYEHLVGQLEPGALFVDIGANFGQHSQYFLAAGWRVVSFEPNPRCREYHETICQLNQWQHDEWHMVGLSDKCGQTFLSYPTGQEWLGSIGDREDGGMGENIRIEIEIAPLSKFLGSLDGAVVKVDVEGYEQHVFNGFPEGLKDVVCVIFEANSNDELNQSVAFFDSKGLETFALRNGSSSLVAETTVAAETNFAAVPKNTRLHTWLQSR